MTRRQQGSRLAALDKKYVWHPFTQMQDYCRSQPLVIQSGKGTYLYDIEGRRYIDGVSSLWVTVHGHRKAAIDQAIIGQVRRLSHSTLLGLAHRPSIELARELVRIAPRGLAKVFYSDNGSTAVEVACKIAFQYWQQASPATKRKRGFVSLKHAYHGDTLGSVSLGGIGLFHDIYRPLLFKTYKAESPYCYRCFLKKTYPQCGLACLNSLEHILKKRHHELAAFVVEPMVQGAAGMIVFPRGYLGEARKLCSRYNVLFVADEVAVGFGRTGKMFACQHEDVRPDLLALAKGITGGTLPLAATLTTESVYRAFLGEPHELKTFYHGHTYSGNPVACAAALANLSIFRQERVLAALQPKIRLLRSELRRFWSLEHVGDVRQCGFMVGIELVQDRARKQPYAAQARIGHRVILEARSRGVIIRPLGDVIVLMPPLAIAESELRTLLGVVFDSIQAVTE